MKEGSKVNFKEDEIVIKPEKSGKDVVEEWCFIVKNKLDKPMVLRRLKEDFPNDYAVFLEDCDGK